MSGAKTLPRDNVNILGSLKSHQITDKLNLTATRSTTDVSQNGKQPALLKLGNYVVDKAIGEGTYGKVRLGYHVHTKDKVAIKIIDKSKLQGSSMQKLAREVKILKLLRHPNIIRLFEVMDRPKELILVMEYAPSGDLHSYLASHGRMNEIEARKLFRQVVASIAYCHSLRIIHRDLKSENLLFDSNMRVKLVDFGFGNIYDPRQHLNTFCGSPPYSAPEIFLGKRYIGPEVDMWSLGVLLYVFLTAALPFPGKTFAETKESVLHAKLRIPFYLSTECEHLLRKLLVHNPLKRMTMQELKNDPWLLLQRPGEPEWKLVVPEPESTVANVNSEVHEKILNEMQSFTDAPADVIKKSLVANNYDELSALYSLLLEKHLHKEIERDEDTVEELKPVDHKENNLNQVQRRITFSTNEQDRQTLMGRLKKKRALSDATGAQVHGSGNSEFQRSHSHRSSASEDKGKLNPPTVNAVKKGPTPLNYRFRTSTTTTMRPKELVHRVLKTLLIGMGMHRVKSTDGERNTLEKWMDAYKMDDQKPKHAGEGRNFYFGTPIDVPWTIRIVETAENSDNNLELDLEICQVYWFTTIFGIKIQRRRGDGWRYQELCQTLIKALNLT